MQIEAAAFLEFIESSTLLTPDKLQTQFAAAGIAEVSACSSIEDKKLAYSNTLCYLDIFHHRQRLPEWYWRSDRRADEICHQ